MAHKRHIRPTNRKFAPHREARFATVEQAHRLDHDAYIDSLRPLDIRAKQQRFNDCFELAEAAALLHDHQLAEYYLEISAYLSMFVIVDEVLDIPARQPAGFWKGGHENPEV